MYRGIFYIPIGLLFWHALFLYGFASFTQTALFKRELIVCEIDYLKNEIIVCPLINIIPTFMTNLMPNNVIVPFIGFIDPYNVIYPLKVTLKN